MVADPCDQSISQTDRQPVSLWIKLNRVDNIYNTQACLVIVVFVCGFRSYVVNWIYFTGSQRFASRPHRPNQRVTWVNTGVWLEMLDSFSVSASYLDCRPLSHWSSLAGFHIAYPCTPNNSTSVKKLISIHGSLSHILNFSSCTSVMIVEKNIISNNMEISGLFMTWNR